MLRTETMNDNQITELSSSQFDLAIANEVILVDFWAPWCMPCRMQKPILEEVAGNIDGQSKIAELNIDEAQDIALRFGVQSIPTLILFKNGSEVRRFVGVQPREILIDAIRAAV
jgi:thioredoxin 1